MKIKIKNIQDLHFFYEFDIETDKLLKKGQVVKIDNIYLYVHDSYDFEGKNTTLHSISTPDKITINNNIYEINKIQLINYNISHYVHIVEFEKFIKKEIERKQKFKRLI